MTSDQLITIAITAGIAAFLKEIFGVVIRSSATTMKKLAAELPILIIKNWEKIDFMISLTGLGLFIWIFFTLDSRGKNTELTHSVVRVYVMLGIMIVMQAQLLKENLQRVRNMKKAEQVADGSPH